MPQIWDPARYAKNAAFVPELGLPVVELLAPEAGERILDLGCGDGVLTEKLAAMGCNVLGIDSSLEQIAAACRRSLDVRVADAQRLDFEREFDAVFSNAALHWMQRPDAVIAGVFRALKPGGRFVAECGGKGNVDCIVRALFAALCRRGIDGTAISPWYYPSPEEYREKLEAAGFIVTDCRLFPRPTPLPGDLIPWLETFAGAFIDILPETERPIFMTEVRDACAPSLKDVRDQWQADYVRLRFRARKPRRDDK